MSLIADKCVFRQFFCNFVKHNHSRGRLISVKNEFYFLQPLSPKTNRALFQPSIRRYASTERPNPVSSEARTQRKTEGEKFTVIKICLCPAGLFLAGGS